MSDMDAEDNVNVEEEVTIENECYGCKNNFECQLAHMDCPNGCLHSKYDCECCSQSPS